MPDATAGRIGSAAPGHYGAAGTALALGEATIATAWNVQGDVASSSFTEAAQRIAGLALPIAPNATNRSDRGVTALWLGPASWLLIAGSASALADIAPAREALNAAGGALFDVSVSRVAYVVEGPRAGEVLAGGCPLDFHPRAFAAGACRQSLLGRVPALFYCHATPGWTVLVARSFARDVWQALCRAGAQHGYTVRAPEPFA